MAIYLTNGAYYVAYSKTGAIKKVKKIKEAQNFCTAENANIQKEKAPKKCMDYYVIHSDENEETSMKKKKRRKRHPMEVRKKIYEEANGRCMLCGRKILFEEMTLDHIIPLAINGADNANNLTAACFACNQFKGSILPEDFHERITEIFLYQMERKYANRLKWKIIHKLLEDMI
ncbi:HNH endonuclease [Kineothrix sp. MB12-C1]|uniref:HNH endonuclease n=1 Tax=Kineothrix sp. MB12-C1 TaxID=3070215 RepID=UPI0027D26680|nr:HNH endonuclease [Kineothrix sp. MB12-C1]WMC94415.1 HNH endonuclease [Kineothrix sp. MB12-C1]